MYAYIKGEIVDIAEDNVVYVYYDKSAKEIYAFGPLMEKIIKCKKYKMTKNEYTL